MVCYDINILEIQGLFYYDQNFALITLFAMCTKFILELMQVKTNSPRIVNEAFPINAPGSPFEKSLHCAANPFILGIRVPFSTDI